MWCVTWNMANLVEVEEQLKELEIDIAKYEVIAFGLQHCKIWPQRIRTSILERLGPSFIEIGNHENEDAEGIPLIVAVFAKQRFQNQVLDVSY